MVVRFERRFRKEMDPGAFLLQMKNTGYELTARPTHS